MLNQSDAMPRTLHRSILKPTRLKSGRFFRRVRPSRCNDRVKVGGPSAESKIWLLYGAPAASTQRHVGVWWLRRCRIELEWLATTLRLAAGVKHEWSVCAFCNPFPRVVSSTSPKRGSGTLHAIFSAHVLLMRGLTSRREEATFPATNMYLQRTPHNG